MYTTVHSMTTTHQHTAWGGASRSDVHWPCWQWTVAGQHRQPRWHTRQPQRAHRACISPYKCYITTWGHDQCKHTQHIVQPVQQRCCVDRPNMTINRPYGCDRWWWTSSMTKYHKLWTPERTLVLEMHNQLPLLATDTFAPRALELELQSAYLLFPVAYH